MTFGPITQTDAAAARQKGFADGYSGRDREPPQDPKLAAQYQVGYRRGRESRDSEDG